MQSQLNWMFRDGDGLWASELGKEMRELFVTLKDFFYEQSTALCCDTTADLYDEEDSTTLDADQTIYEADQDEFMDEEEVLGDEHNEHILQASSRFAYM